MKLRVKSSTTNLTGLSFQIGYAVGVANTIFDGFGVKMVISAGRDGEHSPTSLHYSGKAVDLRTKNIPNETIRAGIFTALVNRLEENGFDVVDEHDHFHIEFDPKAGESFTIISG